MDTQRNSPDEAGSNKLLWSGFVVVVIVVLAMGVTLIRIQAQPQEPRLVALPALEAPPAHTAPAAVSTVTEAATSAAPLPTASSADDPPAVTNKPRIVQPRTPEPAVARSPQREAPKPDAVENDTRSDVTR